jgi:hypothetical protein
MRDQAAPGAGVSAAGRWPWRFVVIRGAKAFSLGWREAARPLLMDYVDRLATEVAPAGGSAQRGTGAGHHRSACR